MSLARFPQLRNVLPTDDDAAARHCAPQRSKPLGSQNHHGRSALLALYSTSPSDDRPLETAQREAEEVTFVNGRVQLTELMPLFAWLSCQGEYRLPSAFRVWRMDLLEVKAGSSRPSATLGRVVSPAPLCRTT